MTPSKDQLEAASQFGEWYGSGAPNGIFFLNGYAGSGKTTTAIRLIRQVGTDDVILIAPTGKAAHRLHLKTGMPTMSCHQLLREFQGFDEDGDMRFGHAEQEFRPKLLVVDEASMVNWDLSQSLLTYHGGEPHMGPVPILALGDPFQLPPVAKRGEKAWCLLDTKKAAPRFTLSTIHRQAEGNGILNLAHEVRTGGKPKMETIGDGSTARVGDQVLEDFLGGNKARAYYEKGVKFIARTRATVHRINSAVRAQRGLTEEGFSVGDVVMTLNNNYDLGVHNGSEFVVLTKGEIGWDGDHRAYEVTLKSLDTGETVELPRVVYEHPLEPIRERLNRETVRITPSYACTCHKYQGSEAERVFVINETAYKSDEIERRRWLYTAITRAKKQVFVLGSTI